MNLTRRQTMLKLLRIFTPKPPRYLRMKIRRRLKQDAEVGLRDNWYHQANQKDSMVWQ